MNMYVSIVVIRSEKESIRVRRNKYKKAGRPKRRFKKSAERQHKSLGGIPMKVARGKIDYAIYVPHNYTKKYDKSRGTYYEDEESAERENATMPEGEGDFIRRHIYEVRFGIDEETDDERRKREYREWWERKV